MYRRASSCRRAAPVWGPWAFFQHLVPGEGHTKIRVALMLDNIDWGLVVAVLTFILGVLAYLQTNKKAERADKTSRLAFRDEAVTHIRNALYDVEIDGNITRKTTASIQRALHLSELVFDDSITKTVERAHTLSYRLQHTPSEGQNARYDQDEDTLKRCLQDALRLMNKEASISD
jgi:hypothetical protein